MQQKSPGPKNIQIKFYKTANEEISNFLSILYNKCVEIGYFPYSLKLAKVIPVHKSGKHSLLNNYRPISLLSPISKIFESLISKWLTKYLDDSNIISDHQFGFRKSHSTSHAITDIYSQISSNKDHDYYTCAILLGLRKAFDTVNHNILLKKLEIYGIRGNILELFYHYLSNRSQFVYVNNTASNKLKIKCCVPQRSNLGPILFSLYINDLPEVSEFGIKLFADDTVLLMRDKNLQKLNETVSKEIEKINTWLLTNKLTINFSKTDYLLFSPKANEQINFSVSIQGNQIKRTQVARYLGILLTTN